MFRAMNFVLSWRSVGACFRRLRASSPDALRVGRMQAAGAVSERVPWALSPPRRAGSPPSGWSRSSPSTPRGPSFFRRNEMYASTLLSLALDEDPQARLISCFQSTAPGEPSRMRAMANSLLRQADGFVAAGEIHGFKIQREIAHGERLERRHRPGAA